MNSQVRYTTIEADYTPYRGRRFADNPFVEALPNICLDKAGLLESLRHEPTRPTNKDRQLPELIRAADLGCVADILYPRPAYQEALFSMVTNLLEAYLYRNPASDDDLLRRHQIASITAERLKEIERTGGIDRLTEVQRFKLGWRGTAPGYALLGATGSGKTTLLDALVDMFAFVIRHRQYKGQALNCTQIPIIKLQIPFDATLRTFILQFFDKVDLLLGEELYGSQGRRSRNTVGAMALQMFKICNAIGLGAFILDDMQNLRDARGANLAITLNLCSLLMEIGGVSVIFSGTPAVGELIEDNSRNIRKLTSGGMRKLGMMGPKSVELRQFQDMYAPHQYTAHYVALDDALRLAWHRAGAGNPAFMNLAFMLAQRHAIGNSERLSPVEFARALDVDMALLKPAIKALRSNSPTDLQRFEDLIFRSEVARLLKAVGIHQTATPADNREFDDEWTPKKKSNTPAKAAKPKARSTPLPKEDPLTLMRVG